DGDALQLFLEPTATAGPSGPSPEWLEHARTPAARIAIRHWLASHPADTAAEPRTAETPETAGTDGGAGEPVPEPVGARGGPGAPGPGPCTAEPGGVLCPTAEAPAAGT
ncbi:bifunctional (p)ppGpp synthetase/guanosine-3',5'-bis(diphosphate) 3'-pyrophosphohydrolase, partial [Streptomyces beijiangensis]|nr:bifunctional (p)ppGpp synthetase/guanosine-3',5'-bis(diphosphate) 3'-pyrophosphohydrolase [Streptomyces beijiangensis]